MIISWALSMMASAIPGRPRRFGACEEDKDASHSFLVRGLAAVKQASGG
jgi:hypothetical protein